MGRNKMRLWFLAAVVGITMVPVMAHAENSCDLEQFSAGNVISSSAVNGNFSCMDGRLGVYEGAIWVDETSGNVGIGTVNPSRELHISSTDGSQIYLQGTTGSWDGIQYQTTEYDGYMGMLESDGRFFIDLDSNGEDLVVTQSGNVGIGTTEPQSILQISGGEIRIDTDANGNVASIADLNDGLALSAWGNAANNTHLFVDNYGNVGIGTTSPSERLEVAGNIVASDYLTSSDARLKTDILPFQDGLEGIACLQAVTYRWKDQAKPQNLQLGLIAQDVEDCFPEIVSTDDNGYKRVAYARIVAPLVRAVQEQQQVMADLEGHVRRQTRENVQLKAQLSGIEVRLTQLEALPAER